VLALAVTSHAHDWNFGGCPSVRPMPNFDLERFLGSWYAIEQYDTDSTCLRFTYERASPTRLFVTKTRELPGLDSVGLQHNTYTGVLDIPDAGNEARMRVKWPLNIAGKGDYTVYDTDYTSYAAVYDCQQLSPLMHRKNAAILSRTPTADAFLVSELKTKLSGQGVESRHFSAISQSGCAPPKPTDSTTNVGPDTIPNLFNTARDELGDAAKDIGDAASSAAKDIGDAASSAIDGITTFFDSIGGTDNVNPDAAEAPNLDRSFINFPKPQDRPFKDEPAFRTGSTTVGSTVTSKPSTTVQTTEATTTTKAPSTTKATTTTEAPSTTTAAPPTTTTTFVPVFNFKTPGSILPSDAANDESLNEIDREPFVDPGKVIRTVVSV